MEIRIQGVVEVAFILPLEGGGQPPGGGVSGVLNHDYKFLKGGVPHELPADRGDEKRPLALGGSGGMKAYEAAASLDLVLKCLALGVVLERLVIGAGEDQGAVPLQVGCGEDVGVLGGIHGKAIFRAHFPNGLNAALGVVMDVAAGGRGGLSGVDENPFPRGRLGGGVGRQQSGHQAQKFKAFHDVPNA